MRLPFRSSILIFAGFFLVFLIGQVSLKNFYSQDDPYYHARHSALINETGNLTLAGPWLVMHFLSTGPTDPWWGYHVLMAGFIHWFGVVGGSKILSACLAALIFTVFYGILRDAKINRPWLWTVLFWGSSANFLFRLLLERPHLLTPIALMLAWHLANRKKYNWLFGLAAIYVLMYHLAPLIMLVIGAQLAVVYYLERRWDWRLLLAPLAGLLLGIILHPQSLNYIHVMYVVIWRVLFLHFSGVDLRLGSELLAKNFLQYLRGNILTLLFFSLAGSGLLAWRHNWAQENKAKIYSLALISGIWLLISMLVPRGIEYWLPFAWLFSAYAWQSVPAEASRGIKNFLPKFLPLKRARWLFCGALVIIMAINVSKITISIKNHNHDPFLEQIKSAAIWLKENTPANSVVFYDNWGYWPQLFYYNQHNRYLSGMDPTFAYEYNQRLYWLWQHISEDGLACGQRDWCPNDSPRLEWRSLAGVVRREFGSEYVLIKDNSTAPFFQALASQKQNFVKVFENDGFIIYRVLAPGNKPNG